MPIYEFECSSCGHRFDHLQKLSDADPANCPSCGKPDLRHMVSAPSFRLAGSGWYETDFKKAGDKKRNLADSGSGEKAAAAATVPAAPATPASAATAAATPTSSASSSGS